MENTSTEKMDCLKCGASWDNPPGTNTDIQRCPSCKADRDWLLFIDVGQEAATPYTREDEEAAERIRDISERNLSRLGACSFFWEGKTHTYKRTWWGGLAAFTTLPNQTPACERVISGEMEMIVGFNGHRFETEAQLDSWIRSDIQARLGLLRPEYIKRIAGVK